MLKMGDYYNDLQRLEMDLLTVLQYYRYESFNAFRGKVRGMCVPDYIHNKVKEIIQECIDDCGDVLE